MGTASRDRLTDRQARTVAEWLHAHAPPEIIKPWTAPRSTVVLVSQARRLDPRLLRLF